MEVSLRTEDVKLKIGKSGRTGNGAPVKMTGSDMNISKFPSVACGRIKREKMIIQQDSLGAKTLSPMRRRIGKHPAGTITYNVTRFSPTRLFHPMYLICKVS